MGMLGLAGFTITLAVQMLTTEADFVFTPI